jgi:cytochrome c oxidase subunit III
VSLVLLYLAALGLVAARWLSRQRLASKPWLEAGPTLALPPRPVAMPTARLGLAVFLAAVGLLFMLLVAAYTMRVPPEIWRRLPDPRIVWLTTGLLIVASLALHGAKGAATHGERGAALLGLTGAATATLGFIAGQVLAWRQLADTASVSDAAAAFFVLMTALHALHLGGGFVALGIVTAKSAGAGAVEDAQPAIGLCALYWDALLAIWLVLFGILFRTPWTGWIEALCRT